MSGLLGGLLGGLGAGVQGYEQTRDSEQQRMVQQQQLKQALTQMQLDQQDRAAQAAALKSFSGVQGQGPGGAILPQQIAGAAGGNPAAFTMLRGAVNPYNTGQFNIDRTQMQQQGANQRNQNTVQGVLDRTNLQQAGASDRAQLGADTRQNIVQQQQAGANQRNQNTVSSKKSSAANPVNLASLPEYKTAKSEYEEAKKDERNIEAHYPAIGQAYNDPQWLDARKRSVAAQAKMEAIQTKAAKTSAPVAATKSEPLPEGAEQFPDGTEIPDESGAVWIKQGNVLVPKG